MLFIDMYVYILCDIPLRFTFIIKRTRCTNFPNLLLHENLHVSGRIRMGLISILVLLESCLQTCMTYTSADCTVNKLLMTGRGTARNM